MNKFVRGGFHPDAESKSEHAAKVSRPKSVIKPRTIHSCHLIQEGK